VPVQHIKSLAARSSHELAARYSQHLLTTLIVYGRCALPVFFSRVTRRSQRESTTSLTQTHTTFKMATMSQPLVYQYCTIHFPLHIPWLEGSASGAPGSINQSNNQCYICSNEIRSWDTVREVKPWPATSCCCSNQTKPNETHTLRITITVFFSTGATGFRV
jgi:hypothetical protein